MRARRRYHRILGFTLALPLLWLCLTGVILNHSAELRLDQRYLTSPALNAIYLDFPEGRCRSMAVGSRTISQWGDHIFLDAGLLPFSGELVGAIALEANLLIATAEHLYLLGPQGKLLDSLDEASLPATPLLAIRAQPTPALKTMAGDVFLFDAELLEFTPSESASVTPAKFSEITGATRKELQLTLSAETPISYGRVLLDLHKFAFLGGFGKWILTISTLGLIALGLTGLALTRKKTKS